MNVDTVIRGAVDRFADRVAFDDGVRSLTFRAFSTRLDRLGTALLGLGMAKGDGIASLQSNSIETIEIDLGAARFGFVRTLLNARGDEDDQLNALTQGKVRALVFGAEFADLVAGMRDRLPRVEHFISIGASLPWAIDYDDLVGRAAALPPPYDVEETDPHSLYYTSGTTGRPKGVLLNQRNWLVVARNHLTDVFSRASPDDVMLHASPLSHASGSAVLAHLARGARQRIMKRFDVAEMLDLFERERVTTLYLAPTMLIMALEREGATRRDLSSLHTVIMGGAPVPAERLAQAVASWGPVFAQGYGQWEAPQVITFMPPRELAWALENGRADLFASCGRAIAFVQVAIMDERGTLLPPGAEGEVVTAGDHLMVGYLNLPEETAELRQGRWQRTGDIGRLDGEGRLYLIDRKKDLIVSGGTNVYPRAIDEVLHQHPDVLEAVSVGVPDDVWGETVHVLVVPRPGRRIDDGAFLDWCKARLSADKRPRSLEIVPDLPRNAYGKVLRREIRQRYWAGRDRRI